MVSLWQIVNAVIIYSWLASVIWLLWRHALGGGTHVHRLQILLNENTQKSIEAAIKSAEAAQEAATAALKMAELLEKNRHA